MGGVLLWGKKKSATTEGNKSLQTCVNQFLFRGIILKTTACGQIHMLPRTKQFFITLNVRTLTVAPPQRAVRCPPRTVEAPPPAGASGCLTVYPRADTGDSTSRPAARTAISPSPTADGAGSPTPPKEPS